VRTKLLLTLALTASLSSAARAETVSLQATQPTTPPRRHFVGLMLDVGVSDLLGLSVVARPVPQLRVHVGGTTDLFSGGIQGGASYIPLKTIASPSLTVEGGYVFKSTTHGIPQSLGIPIEGNEIGYGHFDAHAGLEVGAQKRVSFFLHAGVSYLDISVTPEAGSNMGFKNASLHVWTPSAKLGLMVWL
jgi:hypothetical protein